MKREKKRVIALGFFDGVHLGHAALLEAANTRAKALCATPSVLTFATHPKQLITGAPVPLINSLEDKLELIERLCGIRDVVVLPFDAAFRQMTWMDFVEILRREFHAVYLVCGHDFIFGYGGEGNPSKLRELCQELSLGCDVIPEISLDGQPVSSTYIRRLLEQGAMERANQFLGHPHSLSGTVDHGRKLGRTIGVPTINMALPAHVLIPARGVYATRVFLPGDDARGHMAVTNIGTRPTVEAGSRVTVESYILDFDADLYGKRVRLEFYRYLRPERKFPDIAALRAQIARDAAEVRAHFV